jgi:hypothetical protein
MSKKIESYNKFYDRVYFNFRHYEMLVIVLILTKLFFLKPLIFHIMDLI